MCRPAPLCPVHSSATLLATWPNDMKMTEAEAEVNLQRQAARTVPG